MNSLPFISVIIPNYNKSSFIELAIQSVINQSYTNWELIIVDNSSTDSSSSIIKKFAEQEERIKFYELTAPQNAGAARNEGLKHARGEFVAFLDSDDVWFPSKLEKQLMFMRENQACLSTTYTEIIDTKGNVTGSYQPKRSTADFNEMLSENYISTSATMINLQQCSNISFPSMRFCQDYAAWMLLLKKGFTVHILPETLTKHRIKKKLYIFTKIPKAFFRWRVYRVYLGYNIAQAFFYLWNYAFKGLKKSRDYLQKTSL